MSSHSNGNTEGPVLNMDGLGVAAESGKKNCSSDTCDVECKWVEWSSDVISLRLRFHIEKLCNGPFNIMYW